MSSVCVEHLTDCGVVVVHVLGEPLLGHGPLIELGVSLCEEVVVGLKTCGGEVLVNGPHLLQRECTGLFATKPQCEVEGQEEMLEDKDEEEEENEVDEKVKEIREDAQLMHATW